MVFLLPTSQLFKKVRFERSFTDKNLSIDCFKVYVQVFKLLDYNIFNTDEQNLSVQMNSICLVNGLSLLIWENSLRLLLTTTESDREGLKIISDPHFVYIQHLLRSFYDELNLLAIKIFQFLSLQFTIQQLCCGKKPKSNKEMFVIWEKLD